MLGWGGFALLIALIGGLYAVAAWRQLRWRDDVLVIGALMLAVLAFFWPLFFTSTWIPKGGGDLASFIYPIYAFAARWLRRGVVPLWNPHLYLGMPFAADNQSGLFYPINLLFFLLTPQLTYQAVELMAVLHVFMAGLFTCILLRDMGIGRMAATAGAIAFMLSDLFIVHLGNLNIIATASWLPLILFCFRRAIKRPGWAWVGWSGMVLGIAALVGHVQMFLYVGLAMVAYTLFEMYEHHQKEPAAVWQPALRLLCSGGIAFSLAAISLIPAWDMTRYTVRAALNYTEASRFSLPPQGLIGLLTPGFWGRGTGPFWGPWLRTEVGYIGVLPLLLAAVAVLLTWRRYPLTRFWLILGGLGLLIALGDSAALHGWSYALIPLFRQLRVPARAIVLFDLGIAALAAQGLDALLHPLSRLDRRLLERLHRGLLWVGGALALIGVPLLGHAMLVSRPLAAADVLAQSAASLGSLIFFLLLLAAGVGWLALRRYGLARPATLGAMAVLLIGFDLISLGAYIEIEPNDPLQGYRPDAAMSQILADPEISLGLARIQVIPGAPVSWSPDWALMHDIDDVDGIWNPLRLGAYDVLTWVGIDLGSRFYDLYNVKYVVAHRQVTIPAHFEVIWQKDDLVIYRNARTLPRAWMVYDTQPANSQIQALHLTRDPDWDPARQVVIETEFNSPHLGSAAEGATGQVEIIERGPNHMDFRVNTNANGYLVIGEMWMPDWKASVSGVWSEVARANYTFRAIYVPAGQHNIHMIYRPHWWYVGLGLTLLTCTGLSIWGGWAWFSRRRAARDGPSTPPSNDNRV